MYQVIFAGRLLGEASTIEQAIGAAKLFIGWHEHAAPEIVHVYLRNGMHYLAGVFLEACRQSHLVVRLGTGRESQTFTQRLQP